MSGTEQSQLDRGRELGGVGPDGGRDLRGGRLGHEQHRLDRRVVVQAPHGFAGGQTADGRGQVATTDSEGRRDPDAGMVEESEDLLAARARRGHDAHRTGHTTLANPSPTPSMMAVPQSGPITRTPAIQGSTLERHLVLDRHVVAEDHHVAAGLNRVHGLQQSGRAGNRHQHRGPTRRVPQGVRGRAMGASSPAPAGRRLASARASVDPGQCCLEGAGGLEPDRDDQVVGGRLGRHLEAHLGEYLEVERSCHGNLRGRDTVHALDRPADL